MTPDKMASWDDRRSPIDDHPELLVDEHVPLLKGTIWVILIGSVIFAGLLLISSQESFRRVYATSGLVALAIASLIVLRYFGAVATVRLLAVGGWIVLTCASAVAEGVRTPILLGYPVLLMFSGWLLGARYCLVLFAMSCAAVVALALGQQFGAIVVAKPVPPFYVAVAHLIVLSISAVMTLYLLRVFRKRYAEELHLNAVLQTSESRFRNLLQSVPTVAVQGYGEDGTTRYWNQASERLYGYSADEAIGRNLHELIIPPEMRDDVRAAMQHMFETGQPIPAGELSLMRKDRSRADVFSSHAYVHIPGQAPEMFCLDIDLSQRKKSEDALRQSEARYRSLVQNISAAVVVHDKHTKITAANRTALALLGITEDQAMGRAALDPGWMFLNANGTPMPQDLYPVNQVISSSKALSGVLMGIKRTSVGDIVWVVVSATPVFDGKEIKEVIVSFMDVTQRKQTEELVRQGHKRLLAVLNSIDAIVYVADMKTYEVLFVNKFAQDTFGDIVGQLCWKTIQAGQTGPCDFCTNGKLLDATGNPGGIYHWEFQNTGNGCWYDIHDRAISWVDGRIVRLEIATDVTERKQADVRHSQLEAQLRESQKMEALGTLAGGVAHDFNNALAAILGNVELARQDVGLGHPALVSLEEIGKASRRAKDLVQQILAFSRRQKLERKPMSLALVVVETARLIRATLPAMVSLNVNCEGDTPVVLADVNQIEQILLNLCSNAAHAVEDSGRPGVIEVSLSACERPNSRTLGDPAPARYACLEVQDNGIGMDEPTRSRIFDPFFTTKPAGKGTGLGLSVVHGIVQAHEASIEVESAPDQGSTFRIYFPAIELPAETIIAPPRVAAPTQGMGKHVLYLDDEEAIIFLMKRLLERKGYRVSGYTEPRKALAAVRANPNEFDLAVTDYYMPGMSGLEVAMQLTRISPTLPVIMASGYISEELRAKAPAAGIRELIYKPNSVEDLCDAVARFANAQSGNKSSSSST